MIKENEITPKLVVRTALTIKKSLTEKTADLYLRGNGIDAMTHLKDLLSQREKCVRRGFCLSVEKIDKTISYSINRIRDGLDYVYNQVTKKSTGLNLKDLIDDLNALKNSFPSLKIVRGRISVVTDPIELENIYLGRFKIILNMTANLSDMKDFLMIEALEPNPPRGKGGVTHPHVQDRLLCAGDGHDILMDALSQGRIEDFFNLVITILNTYNHVSPYVPLDEWEGESCCSCGERVDEDSCSGCGKCGENVCNECSSYCEACSSSYCSEHGGGSCHGCGNWSCSNCCETHSECSGCDESYCDGCLSRCDKCDCLMCEDCAKLCSECGKNLCSECVTECGECEDTFCEKHIMNCGCCGKNFCKDHYDEDECSLLKENVKV